MHISGVAFTANSMHVGVSRPCYSQLVSLKEAKLLLKEDDELIKEVFEYWSRKRKGCHAGYLIPSVKHEKRDGSSTSDPYVGFRRRTEKMQTRKVRLWGRVLEVGGGGYGLFSQDGSRTAVSLTVACGPSESQRYVINSTIDQT